MEMEMGKWTMRMGQLGELGQKAWGDVYKCGGWVEAGLMRGVNLGRQVVVNMKVQVL
jgi:hypothetical protein